MRALAAVASGVLVAFPLAGQTTGVLYGSVSDSAGRGLPHARVRTIPLARSGPARAATAFTDEHGRYRLDSLPAGWLAVEAGRIGYRPAKDSVLVPSDDSVRLDLRLPASPILLQPTIVTAAKRSQLIDQAATSVAALPEERIAQRSVNTIDEAVDKAPGVQFINGQVNIRGSSGFAEGLGSRVLLLVDGVPVNQGDRGGINWDVIPVDRVERVEVVKGAGSALYGSSAFGGVVNLITRELSDGLHARVRATAGVFADPPHDVWRFRGYHGIQDGLDLATSYGRGLFRGGLSAGARHSDGYQEQDRADHWQLTGKGEWRAQPQMLVSLSGAWASDQYQVPGPWCSAGCDTQGQAYQPFKIEGGNRGNWTRSDKGYLTAIVTRTPSERASWTMRASWLRTHFIDAYPNRQPPEDFSLANRYGAEARVVNRLDPGHVVTVGAELTRADVTSNIFSGDTTDGERAHTQGEYAAYAEAEQAFGRLRLTIGARSDFQVVDGGGVTAFVSPRAGAVWPTASGSWRASAGRAYRAPSLAERFVTTVAFGFPVVPNPTLLPEEGWSVEIGRSWTVWSWLRGDAAAFWTDARRLIEPTLTSAGVIQFQNVQRARLVGLDLSVDATPPVPHLTTGLAYQFLYARELAHDTVSGRPLLFRPRHLLTLSADYEWRSLDLGTDVRYSSRYERADPIYGDAPIACKVLDLRAGWMAGPFSVRLKVANALNYIYNLAPRTLEPVRTATVTLTYAY